MRKSSESGCAGQRQREYYLAVITYQLPHGC